ncbi:MAG: septum formation initiator family protein [Eubacterium sp.]|nr:septum formation initiator family protein [Eubacterium sp.]
MAYIFITVGILSAVLFTSSMKLEARLAEGNQQVAKLQEAIDDENARTEEIDSLQREMKTDDYKKQVAKDKLGLVEDGEIIFKEANGDE